MGLFTARQKFQLYRPAAAHAVVARAGPGGTARHVRPTVQPPALDLGANPLFHGWALVVAAMVILLTRDPGKHQHLLATQEVERGARSGTGLH